MLQQALLKAFEQMEMLKKEVSDLRKKEDHLRTINRALGSLYVLALEDKQVLSRVVLEDGQKTYAVEDGIQVIGNNAFSFCSELSAVTIPDSVVRIGEGTFTGVPRWRRSPCRRVCWESEKRRFMIAATFRG